MRRKTKVADDAVLLEFLGIVQQAVVEHIIIIAVLIDIMNQTNIAVICAECLELLFKSFFDLRSISRPRVRVSRIRRANMHLCDKLVPLAFHRFAHQGSRGKIRHDRIDQIDAPVGGIIKYPLYFVAAGFMNGAGANANRTDFRLGMRQHTVRDFAAVGFAAYLFFFKRFPPGLDAAARQYPASGAKKNPAKKP